VVKKITRINKFTKEKFVFPVIIVPKSLDKTNKINNTLRKEILHANIHTPVDKIFDKVWQTKKNDYLGALSINFEILFNKRWLLAIKFDEELCGAYCEGHNSYYNFNLKTGNTITLFSLFNKVGQKKILQYLDSSKISILKNKLLEVQDTLKVITNTNRKDDIDYYKEMMELYQGCLEKYYKVNDMTYLKFYIVDKTITIYSDRCSAHYNRSLDEINEFEYKIDLINWLPFLTSLGKTLIK
jgi:hypothetical protein